MEDQNSNRPLYDYTSRLRLTLKAWPAIAVATIGLCYLTQTVAKWFGIELPDQANIELVKRYAGWNRTFVFLCAQVLVLMPAIEELIFRYLLFKLPLRLLLKRGGNRFFHPLLRRPLPLPTLAGRGVPRPFLLRSRPVLALSQDRPPLVRDPEPRALQPDEPRAPVHPARGVAATTPSAPRSFAPSKYTFPTPTQSGNLV